jgi:two-component system NtrC family sensor kinase
MRKLSSTITDYFRPNITGIDVDRYDLLIIFNFITSLFSLFYVLVSEVILYKHGIYIMLANFVIFLSNLFLIKKGIGYRKVVNIYLANCLFVAILGCTFFSGGLYSPVIPWFVLVPVTSLLLLGSSKNTLFWLVATSLCVLSFLIIHQLMGIELDKNFDSEWSDFFFYTCIGGLVLILYLVTQVFENIKNNALNEVSKKNEELQTAIHQLQNAQEQLVQQEKLASLGQLTAGIAHEIRNPLNFVNNFSRLSIELFHELHEDPDGKNKEEILGYIIGNLNKIKHHGDRADFIVKSMLLHSRSGSDEFSPTDVNEIAKEYLNLCYLGMRASEPNFNCKLEKHLEKHLPAVECVEQDISRVILNLLNNAMYAVCGMENAIVSISTAFDDSHVYIKVKDNGCGMNDETKRKLFEPFYTTKPTGKGTGLGLSISFDIVKAHGGQLDVESEYGKGSLFTVSLPLKK